MSSRSILLCCMALASLISQTQPVPVEKDVSLTSGQVKALGKFTERMKPHLTEDYMTEPIYLVRWLRAKNFDVDQAEKMLIRNLKWRKENNVDNIDKEDWSYFEEEFAYNIDTVDKWDRPVLTIDSSKWDVRQAVISGQRDKLVRWMTKMMEDATKKVRQLEKEGKTVTRWSLIFNLGYFNLVQSGCLQCLTVYTEFVQNYESYYPNTVDKITLVNTPTLFDVILRVIRPLFSPETRDSLVVYGLNKQEWQRALLKEIRKDQLPVEYGGSKERDNID